MISEEVRVANEDSNGNAHAHLVGRIAGESSTLSMNVAVQQGRVT